MGLFDIFKKKNTDANVQNESAEETLDHETVWKKWAAVAACGVSASKSDSAAHAAVNTMPAANTAPMFLSATATNRKNSTILIIVFISHLSPPAPAATIKTFIMIIHIIFTHILIFSFSISGLYV